MEKQHWLYGDELLKALMAAGVVPTMTQSVEIVVTHGDFVTVRADVALSTEQLRAAAAGLPVHEDEEKRRMQAVVERTKAREAS